MGRDKALMPWPPTLGSNPSTETFLSSAIRALNPFNDMVLVVVGKNETNLAPIIYAKGASVVTNPAPERGQFSSLQTGLQEVLNQGRDAATVTLVDRPPVSFATLKTLHEAFETAVTNGKWAVVPQYQGQHGHPFLIGREMLEAFLRAEPTSTARDVEHQQQQYVEYVAVNDPFVALNVDTPEQYAALAAEQAK
jgi:molybdenum cofactor cytidylyltransferase